MIRDSPSKRLRRVDSATYTSHALPVVYENVVSNEILQRLEKLELRVLAGQDEILKELRGLSHPASPLNEFGVKSESMEQVHEPLLTVSNYVKGKCWEEFVKSMLEASGLGTVDEVTGDSHSGDFLLTMPDPSGDPLRLMVECKDVKNMNAFAIHLETAKKDAAHLTDNGRPIHGIILMYTDVLIGATEAYKKQTAVLSTSEGDGFPHSRIKVCCPATFANGLIAIHNEMYRAAGAAAGDMDKVITGNVLAAIGSGMHLAENDTIKEMFNVAKRIDDNRLHYNDMTALFKEAHTETEGFSGKYQPLPPGSSDSLSALCEMWHQIREHIDTLPGYMQEARLESFRKRLERVSMEKNRKKHVLSALNLVQSSAKVNKAGRKPGS